MFEEVFVIFFKDKIPDITNLAANATVNSKINEIKNKISSITNLAMTAALTTVENIRNGKKYLLLLIVKNLQVMHFWYKYKTKKLVNE